MSASDLVMRAREADWLYRRAVTDRPGFAAAVEPHMRSPVLRARALLDAAADIIGKAKARGLSDDPAKAGRLRDLEIVERVAARLPVWDHVDGRAYLVLAGPKLQAIGRLARVCRISERELDTRTAAKAWAWLSAMADAEEMLVKQRRRPMPRGTVRPVRVARRRRCVERLPGLPPLEFDPGPDLDLDLSIEADLSPESEDLDRWLAIPA